jgi:hypothetical protein
MKDVLKVRDNISKARELQRGTTREFATMLDRYRQDRIRFRMDRNLTEKGQDQAIERLRKKHEVLVLGKSRSIKDRYEKNLQNAKQDAEAILLQALPKVEDRKQQLFNLRLKELEGQIMFATNAEAAMSALNEMLEAADEPALALQVKEKFVGLSQNVLALVSDTGEQISMRKGLADLYNKVSVNSQPEGAEKAAILLDEAARMLTAGHIYTDLIGNALQEISRNATIYLEKPDDYFADYADEVKQVMFENGLREVDVTDDEE